METNDQVMGAPQEDDEDPPLPDPRPARLKNLRTAKQRAKAAASIRDARRPLRAINTNVTSGRMGKGSWEIVPVIEKTFEDQTYTAQLQEDLANGTAHYQLLLSVRSRRYKSRMT